MAKEKLKFAFYWAASCGGCEIAVLDINEKILDVAQIADIVFWPVAMDIKYKDVENMPDKYIVCFFNGAIRTEENEKMAKLLRKKSKILIAYGACAQLGGIPGLANIANRKEVFEKAFLKTFSTHNPNNVIPKTRVTVKEGELELPEFYDTVKTLDQTVEVDYYVPGCPPAVERTLYALETIAKGELPPKGSVLAPLKSVCDECPRKREEKKISKIYRVYEKTPDPERCLLEQGILCMGPATRGGCGARCLKVNMPCTGCGGPCPNVPEQGAAMISALASILGLEEEKEKYSEEEVEKLISQIKDPLGTFYMYALPASILRRKVMKK
ncbi:oxidoreductase [Candidatus Bathyarchaeota archaeon]|nr:MAG: oxidoreductase [Candidatus Bathyarchaeota archaeon]